MQHGSLATRLSLRSLWASTKCFTKPLLTLDRFIEDTDRIKEDAINQIQMCQTLALLEQIREKFLAEYGLIPNLYDKIELLPGEFHPEAGAYLKKRAEVCVISFG